MKKVLLSVLLVACATAGRPKPEAAERAQQRINKELITPLNTSLVGGRMFSRIGPAKYYRAEIQGYAEASRQVPFKVVLFDRTLPRLQPAAKGKGNKASNRVYLIPSTAVAEGNYDVESGKIHIRVNGKLMAPADFIPWYKKHREGGGTIHVPAGNELG